VAAAADGCRYKGVGIDIESLRSPPDAFKKLAFGTGEQDLIRSIACDDPNEWWLRLWCAKESVAKSLGKGLLGVPKGITARRIDPQTGAMDFELSEKYVGLSGAWAGQTLQAHTFRDADVIGSLAALAANHDAQRASVHKSCERERGIPAEAERMPFVGRVLSYVPGERLLALRQFDLEEDLFLLDHTLGRHLSIMDEALRGLPVMPLTVSMEMMAETAGLLVPDRPLVGMRAVRAYRWMAFDRKEVGIRMEAACLNPQEVIVKLWDEQDFGSHRHLAPLPIVEATILFDHQYPQAPVAGEFALRNQRPSIWRSGELYSEGMFHGPQFRGVTSVEDWGEDGIRGTLRSMPVHGFFRSHGANPFVLDPVLMDAAGQMVAYWFVEEHQEIGFNTYPYRIDAVRFYGPNGETPAEVEGRVRIQTVKENQIKADIQVLGQDGRIRMELLGWEDRAFRLPSAFYNLRFRPTETFLSKSCAEWVKGLKTSGRVECCRMEEYANQLLLDHGRIWLRVLAYLALSRGERLTWSELNHSGASDVDWLLARVAGKDAVRRLLKERYGLSLCLADIEFDSVDQDPVLVKGRWMEDLPCSPSVCVSWTERLGVALAAEKGERCGIAVLRRSLSGEKESLRDLLDEERYVLDKMVQIDKAEWIMRIHCAKEAIFKALGRRLPGGTADLKMCQLDVDKGFIHFEFTGKARSECPRSGAGDWQAYTSCENDLVFGIVLFKE
jgi:phosphopantetheinyl transferase